MAERDLGQNPKLYIIGPTRRPARPEFPVGHRGRERFAALREMNRKKVMEAPSSGVFWKEVKRLADPKPAPVSVTANSLKEVFEARLNPPKVLPNQFDATQHGINKVLASLLPEKTEDNTPEGFFSEKWTEDDMARLKDHLRKHSLDSSEGEDHNSYAELLEIPNDDLARLCNECIARKDGRSI